MRPPTLLLVCCVPVLAVGTAHAHKTDDNKVYDETIPIKGIPVHVQAWVCLEHEEGYAYAEVGSGPAKVEVEGQHRYKKEEGRTVIPLKDEVRVAGKPISRLDLQIALSHKSNDVGFWVKFWTATGFGRMRKIVDERHKWWSQDHPIREGDKVFFKTSSGKYVNCSDSKKNVTVKQKSPDRPERDEYFFVDRRDGPGTVLFDDEVIFRTLDDSRHFRLTCRGGEGNLTSRRLRPGENPGQDEFYRMRAHDNVREEPGPPYSYTDSNGMYWVCSGKKVYVKSHKGRRYWSWGDDNVTVVHRKGGDRGEPLRENEYFFIYLADD